MKRGDRITLDKLRRLALRWCPPEARWDSLIARTRRRSWGPAHELGHALIEPVERWSMPDYGRCSTGFCRCVGGECDVVERAAMLISSRLVAYAGYPDLAIDERTSTDGYDLIASPYYERRAKRMLVKLGLWPVPYTMSRLTSALARRETLARQHDRRDTAHELDITNATLARQPASRDTHPGGSKTLARQPASRDRSPPTSRSLGSLPADANTKCIRTCDAAVLVLRETGNPAVMWGDTHLLHEIAKRAGLKINGWKTERQVLNNLTRCPGILIPKHTICGGHERLVRIFRLPNNENMPGDNMPGVRP